MRDDIETTHWEHTAWMCQRCGDGDGHPSRLQLVDSRDLSISSRDVWEDDYDRELYQRREVTETAVVCPDCETVFDVEFVPREDAEE
ncbi:hypothetical protein ACFQMM_19310 [Saliphagus sp. GCM10025308]